MAGDYARENNRFAAAASQAGEDGVYLSRAQEERLMSGRTVTDYGDDYADGDGALVGSTGALRRNRGTVDELKGLLNEARKLRAEMGQVGGSPSVSSGSSEGGSRLILDPADDAGSSVTGPGLRLTGNASGEGLVARFGDGLLGALKGVTVEPVLQVRDLSVAGASVVYNELMRGDGEGLWLPETKSGMADAYANGASQSRLLLQSNSLTGIGVVSYDLTTAAMNGDWGGVAEGAGGLVGGLAIGKSMSKYGGYGLTFDDIGATGPMASQMGAIRPRLVTPLSELRAQYGVNEANLVVEATFEHQGNLFYDVNQTARNPALATDDHLPIYSESRARLGAPNQTMADAHAEVGAMAQSYGAGTRGGSATLTIMGKDACTYCLSDVKRMGLQLQLDELTVIQPSGMVRFNGPQDFAPVKLGGKKWGG